jgi:hypothetical protein
MSYPYSRIKLLYYSFCFLGCLNLTIFPFRLPPRLDDLLEFPASTLASRCHSNGLATISFFLCQALYRFGFQLDSLCNSSKSRTIHFIRNVNLLRSSPSSPIKHAFQWRPPTVQLACFHSIRVKTLSTKQHRVGHTNPLMPFLSFRHLLYPYSELD